MTTALERLFRPRSIALVGATERSAWSNNAYGNLVRLGYEGAIHLVNRRGGTIYDRAAATSVAAIGEPVDVALLMVPEPVLLETLADVGAAGIGAAVALSSGFAETGDEGRARQQTLTEAARAANVRLLGPNCLGFVGRQGVPVIASVRATTAADAVTAAQGIGGAVVEPLGDTSLRLLPIGEDDALAMLGELRGAKLLDGLTVWQGAPA